jgi:hypothetical protein
LRFIICEVVLDQKRERGQAQRRRRDQQTVDVLSKFKSAKSEAQLQSDAERAVVASG